jgi:hypothetical protein
LYNQDYPESYKIDYPKHTASSGKTGGAVFLCKNMGLVLSFLLQYYFYNYAAAIRRTSDGAVFLKNFGKTVFKRLDFGIVI